jgi:hypothetical protein
VLRGFKVFHDDFLAPTIDANDARGENLGCRSTAVGGDETAVARQRQWQSNRASDEILGKPLDDLHVIW